MNFKARTLKKNGFSFGFGRGAQVGEDSFLEVEFTAQASTLGVSFSFGKLQALRSHQPSILEEKIARRLPSWQRSGVVSQQRLWLRRFDSLVKCSPKLRFEPGSFLFLVCFCIAFDLSFGVGRHYHSDWFGSEMQRRVFNNFIFYSEFSHIFQAAIFSRIKPSRHRNEQ